MRHYCDNAGTWIRRLADDTAANALAMSAVALVPLLAMVGGGIDASRYYMTESRLQAACDAGALAARRSMDSDAFANEHRRVGNKFFDHNFPDGTFGLENRTRSFDGTEEGEVKGVASGKLPTTIMAVFGYQEFDVQVECSADINITNTDVMFVLDVTHSMNCPADNPGCDNSYEWANSKLDNLRSSVLAFYDTVEEATSSAARIRYGIMPYSSQVNVGAELDAAWMASSHTYQSREPNYKETYHPSKSYRYTRIADGSNWRYQTRRTTTYSNSSLSDCSARAVDTYDIYHSSDQSGWTQTDQYGTPPVTSYEGIVTFKLNEYVSRYYDFIFRTCRVTTDVWLYDAQAEIEHYPAGSTSREFENWAYKPVTYDLTSVYSTGKLVAPTGWDAANVTHEWNGCIEEAETVATGDFDPIPEGAYDLDIDLVPGSAKEKWKPMMPTLVWPRVTDMAPEWFYSRYWSRATVYSAIDWGRRTPWCPKAARKLDVFDNRDELERWLSADEGFVVAGNTYHDYGMIWGARFISPDGIFAAENRTAPNGDAVSRHIIFMTDGEQATANYDYTPHGIEWWDRRLTTDGSEAQLADRHASRFQAACKAARNKNISVWVVAFGTELTQNLVDCATPGRIFQAADSAELNEAFTDIARQIAALRLTE